MKRRTAVLRAASNLIALEPRMLFDGAAAVSADFIAPESKSAPSHAAPVIDSETLATTHRDQSVWFDGLAAERHSAPVTISDADQSAGAYRVDLSIAHGVAHVADDAGIAITGNDTECVSFTGDLNAVNQVLAGLRFDPYGGYQGWASVGVEVVDPDGLHGQQLIHINVADLNRAPVAGDDTRSLSPTIPILSGNVITAGAPGETADYDPDGDPFGVYGLALGRTDSVPIDNVGVPVQGLWGQLQIENDGSYSYRPGPQLADMAAGETRSDVFTYLICDPSGAIDTATLSFVIHAGDDGSGHVGGAPDAADDYRCTVEGRILVDGQAIAGNDLGDARDTDPDGDPLHVVGAAAGSGVATPIGQVGEPIQGQWGQLTILDDGSYVYTPGAAAQSLRSGEFVQDPFTYTVADPAGNLDTALISICTAGLDGSLLARPDLRTISEPAPGVEVTVRGNVVSGGADGDQADIDEDGDPILVQGIVAGASDAAAVSSLGADGAFGAVAGGYGSLTLRPDGSYVYTPGAAARDLAAGDRVDDVFTYTINDGTGRVSTTTLTIRIVGENGPPIANPDANRILVGAEPVSGNVIANGGPGDRADSDPDPGDILSVTGTLPGEIIDATTGVSATGEPIAGHYGSLLVAPDGGYRYTVDSSLPELVALAPGDTVQDAFTVTVRDQAGASARSTLIVTIVGVNDAPSAPTVSRVIPGGARFGDPASHITDVPAPTDPDQPPQDLSVTVTSLPDPANGQFVLGDGQPLAIGTTIPAAELQNLSFVPAASPASAPDAQGLIPAGALGFLVDDGHGGTAPGAINVAITPIPAALPPAPADGGGSGTGGSGVGSSVPGLLPPVLIDPLEKPPSGSGGGLLPTDPLSPFGPQRVLGMVEVADGEGGTREGAARLANVAVAADDDCVPADPNKPPAHARPKIVPRSALTEFAKPKARHFSEQVTTEAKRFKPPAKVRVRATPGRQC